MPDLSLQDDEYLAALKADTEKELKAREEAEIRRLEEAAAREAFLQEERNREEETRRKLLEAEVLYINCLGVGSFVFFNEKSLCSLISITDGIYELFSFFFEVLCY